MDQRASSRNARAVLNGRRKPQGSLGRAMGAETKASNRAGGTRKYKPPTFPTFYDRQQNGRDGTSGTFQRERPVMFCFIELHNIILNLCVRC